MASTDVRSLTSSIGGVDPSSLTDDELSSLVVDVERLLNAAHALSAVALDEFDRRGRWVDDGSLSAAGWAAGRTGSAKRDLRARLRAGGGLRLLPSACGAAREGLLSPGHVEALAGCARRYPELASRDEAVLVDLARSFDTEMFVAAARRWRECAEAVDGPDPAGSPVPEPVDELHLSRTLDGRYRLDGTLCPETGQLVHAALESEVDGQLRAARDGDPSVPMVASQRRAAALVDLVAQRMRRERSEASAPDRYRVAVVVAADQAGRLPMACCDSAAFRVVLGADREVLDVGRLTSVWPAGMRRAITLRDGGCVFPGCDRPPSWCDIHHCVPWSEGGSTSVGNGALLCRRHHTFVHRHRWTVCVDRERAVTRRPDGTPHVVRRWDTGPPDRHAA